jgi:hypothetical protein
VSIKPTNCTGSSERFTEYQRANLRTSRQIHLVVHKASCSIDCRIGAQSASTIGAVSAVHLTAPELYLVSSAVGHKAHTERAWCP